MVRCSAVVCLLLGSGHQAFAQDGPRHPILIAVETARERVLRRARPVQAEQVIGAWIPDAEIMLRLARMRLGDADDPKTRSALELVADQCRRYHLEIAERVLVLRFRDATTRANYVLDARADASYLILDVDGRRSRIRAWWAEERLVLEDLSHGEVTVFKRRPEPEPEPEPEAASGPDPAAESDPEVEPESDAAADPASQLDPDRDGPDEDDSGSSPSPSPSPAAEAEGEAQTPPGE